MDICLFSRGRGRGHAVRDLAIAKELRARRPSLEIAFASYSAGAEILRAAGETCHDLLLPEKNGYPDTLVRCAQLMREIKPRLVVAQEEPSAITAAAVVGIRSVFTTHWFAWRDSHLSSQALGHAASILFLEESGLFAEPVQAAGRIHYCGPVLRPFTRHPSEAETLRVSLGLKSSESFILVLPGSPSERREPIFDLVSSAFRRLRVSPKRLLWVAGNDYAKLIESCETRQDISVIGACDDVDLLIISSNLVITKGTYNISREVMAIGRPSISLTHHFNPVDDFYAARSPNNQSLPVLGTSEEQLADTMLQALQRQCYIAPDYQLLKSSGAGEAAKRLISELEHT
jgi:predicted glycosyltransferase